MFYLLSFLIIFCMVMSLRTLFYPSKRKERMVSIQNFLFLGMCFITIMLGFGLLYMLLELKGIHILMENGEYISGDFFDYIYTTMYFSGVTFFSVGYGDVIPIGLGRIAALIESWLGFTIPAAFVVKSFINYEKN